MKINVIETYKLRNNEHFWFMTEIKSIIEAIGVKHLGVEDIFSEFTKLYNKESNLIKKDFNHSLYSKIEDSDAKRDDYHAGIQLIVKGNLKHAKPEHRSAASKLKQILDKYSDAHPLSYNEDSESIDKLCSEMEKQKKHLETLHLTEWIDMLKAENDTFQQHLNAIKQKFEASSPSSIKITRRAIDHLYDELIHRIKALSTVKGDWKYLDIINKINARIDKLKTSTNHSLDSHLPMTDKYTPETFY